MDNCRIAVVGATGAVGQVFLRILEERTFPLGSIRLCASERSLGKTIVFRGEEVVLEKPTAQLLRDVDIVFVSATGGVSSELVPIAVSQGALVIDDSSIFRMSPNVPLVVPEVNADDLKDHCGVVAIPNCSTTPLVMVLKPLNDLNPIRRVIVDTYQSVSGTGSVAVEELRVQTDQILSNEVVDPDVYPHQIAFNLFPHIEPFLPNGYTKEEMKIVEETRKILHLPSLSLSATCVRVPVMIGHSEAVHIEFDKVISPLEVRQILADAAGIRVIDDPELNIYPMPIDAAESDDVLVGRIRQDESCNNGVALWLSCDNLRKGAALNAIQIAESIMDRDLIDM